MMKTIKLLYLPLVLLLAGNVQGQNEDPCIADPDWCGKLFIRLNWKNMNNIQKPDDTKNLRKLVVAPLPQLDSIFIKIGTDRDKGEGLDIRGKKDFSDLKNRFVDFGIYGIKPINESTDYNLNFDFDLQNRIDKDKFIFITVSAIDVTGTKSDYEFIQIGQTLKAYSYSKESFGLKLNFDPIMQRLKIKYYLANPANTKVDLWNSSGVLVKKIDENVLQVGEINKEYSVMGIPPGIYILQVTVGSTFFTEKFPIK